MGIATGQSLLRYNGWVPGFINLKIKGKRWKSFEAMRLRVDNEKFVAKARSAIQKANGQEEKHI